MTLLEREPALTTLSDALRDARAGEGKLVLISGEAGIGKTSLVEHFAERCGTRVLWGRCDPLLTPSPLAPFRDIAARLGGKLGDVLAAGVASADLLPILLETFQRSAPLVVVIEDVHWADEATLDALKYVGRRIQGSQALLLLTMRDDELDARHPLRSLLAALATSRSTRRIPLAPLSLSAVGVLLQGSGYSAETVHRQTGGNPFFVSELVAAGDLDCVPAGVRDLVEERLAGLPGEARKLLDAAAVVGPRADVRLLARVLGAEVDDLDPGLVLGLARIEGETLVMRHELTRQAVLATMPLGRKVGLHSLVLKALLDLGERDASLLAHHAEAAGDVAAVRLHARTAAREARASRSHREAAAQFERALRHTGPDRADERARLLEGFAEECALLDRQDDAVAARKEAAALWHGLGDARREGENLAAMAWPLVRSGRNQEADECSRRAIDLLDPLGPGRELAAALRIRAHLRMLDRDRSAAIACGRKALAMAKAVDDPETLAAANLVIGASMLVSDDPEGRVYLDRSIELGRRHGLDSLVALAYLNIGSSYGEQYHLADAELYLQEAVTYATERDLEHSLHYSSAWLALVYLYQGRWSEAAKTASDVLRVPALAVVSRIMALVALGRVRARRGDPGVWSALDEALELASGTATLQRIAPVRAARAESAWLGGDIDKTRSEAVAAWDLALRHRHSWHLAEFGFWRSRAGDEVSVPAWAARPFALQIRGQWAEAAAEWESRGCPYERAQALAQGDDEARREALRVFDRLGARPAAEALRQLMRDEGASRVPRGPTSATRGNDWGLTRRQAEILALLPQGLTNAAIARRLHISPKTVDHHVSAILAKLGATSRAQAARSVLPPAPSKIGETRIEK